MRHEPVGHLLRHLTGRAGPVARQHELADTPQVDATVELAEQARHGGMQHVAGNDGTRGGRGRGGVFRQAAMHHAGDLDDAGSRPAACAAARAALAAWPAWPASSG